MEEPNLCFKGKLSRKLLVNVSISSKASLIKVNEQIWLVIAICCLEYPQLKDCANARADAVELHPIINKNHRTVIRQVGFISDIYILDLTKICGIKAQFTPPIY